jgi:type IV pilus assembly protein PilO
MEQAELKKLIAIGVAVLLGAYFIYSGVGPWVGVAGLRKQADTLKVERRKLELSVQSAQAMVGNLDKIKKERETLEVQLKEISKRLPGERESAEVLRSVESLAGKSGLTIAGVKRRAVKNQELYVEIPMEVGVGGGYHDLVRFADQLAQLNRLVTLTEVQVQRPAATLPGQITAAQAAAATPGTIRAQVVAVVFQALPEPAEVPVPGPGGAPVPATPAVAPAR